MVCHTAGVEPNASWYYSSVKLWFCYCQEKTRSTWSQISCRGYI